MNEIKAGLGRFSGAADRFASTCGAIWILHDQYRVFVDWKYPITVKNGQKWSILVLWMKLRRVSVGFRVLRIVCKYFQSDPDTLTPISDICGLKISDNGQKWSKMFKNGLFYVVLTWRAKRATENYWSGAAERSGGAERPPLVLLILSYAYKAPVQYVCMYVCMYVCILIYYVSMYARLPSVRPSIRPSVHQNSSRL